MILYDYIYLPQFFQLFTWTSKIKEKSSTLPERVLLKLESDDVAPQRHEDLQTFVWWGWGESLCPLPYKRL